MIPSCQSRLVGSPPPFAVADLSLRLASSAARRPYDGAAASMAQYHLSAQLRGHEDDVRGICICGDAGIATSSRDRTVRFWTQHPEKKHEYVLSKTLVGHSSFVGPLAWIPPSDRFPEGGLVSGGMDTLVLLWDLHKGEVVETMKGHTSQVTGLAVDNNGDIISSSMDCTVRRWRNGSVVEAQVIPQLSFGKEGHVYIHSQDMQVWALTGQPLLEMIGHTSLVYSVDAHSSGVIVSGSEDRSAKIWKDGICVQSIEHPGCIWGAKFLENGDIVTACSDGIVRIWTTDNNRFCSDEELAAFTDLISQYILSRKTVGGLKLSDLPGIEALQVPGNSDGQTLIVREGDNGVAYSWNSKELKWDKIGEVVDGPGDAAAAPGQFHDGVRYDFVFNVDIGDGEPMRKLPYNRSDDPYAVADKWLLKENLPLTYRQQVVEFILQNSGQNNFVPDPSFRDPYTGANAYVPGQSASSTVSAPKPTFKHIPKNGMLTFETAQFEGILKKLSEFNATLSSNLEQKELSLSEIELSRLAAIAKVLKETSFYHTSKLADADMTLLLKMLKSWPTQMMFPVIDFLRMFVLHPDGATLLLKAIESGNDVLAETFHKVVTPPVQPPNVLTTLKAVTNLFDKPCLHQWLRIHGMEIIDSVSSCKTTFSKNAHLAYSTLLLNYAVLSIESKDEQSQAQILSAALEIAEDDTQVADSKYRALMLNGLVKSIALDLDVKSVANTARASKDSKIAEVGADIELLTR
uniref:Phospholipase A-2-activating protein n=1 Tax=Oryza rufipogon TaxID=4529 RepID=A0A0E0Q3K2_ORYRU